MVLGDISMFRKMGGMNFVRSNQVLSYGSVTSSWLIFSVLLGEYGNIAIGKGMSISKRDCIPSYFKRLMVICLTRIYLDGVDPVSNRKEKHLMKLRVMGMIQKPILV